MDGSAGTIIATGTDIVSVARVAGLIETGGERFLGRWFTEAEIAYCSSMARPALHFAARLAAKEAVVKVLRAPSGGPLPWRSIEIGHDAAGAPTVRLADTVLETARRTGVGPLQVSLSHCEEYAVAVAVAVVG